MKRILVSIALSSVLLSLSSAAAAGGISTVPGSPEPKVGIIVEHPDAGVIIERPGAGVIVE